MRTDREAWVQAGLALLRDEGEGALRLDRICERVGRTKGSFYHHFGDLDGLFEAMLARWREQLTTELIEATSRVEPGQRRAAMNRLARAIDVRLELAIRAWGLRHARARRAIEEVDGERVAYLESLWIGGGVTRGARTLARLEYASFVGAMQLYPDLSERAVRDLSRALERALDHLASEG